MVSVAQRGVRLAAGVAAGGREGAAAGGSGSRRPPRLPTLATSQEGQVTLASRAPGGVVGQSAADNDTLRTAMLPLASERLREGEGGAQGLRRAGRRRRLGFANEGNL